MGAESREIYLKGRHSREVRAYHKMLRQLLIELGVHSLDAESDVEEIVELESRLANVRLVCLFSLSFAGSGRKTNLFCSQPPILQGRIIVCVKSESLGMSMNMYYYNTCAQLSHQRLIYLQITVCPCEGTKGYKSTSIEELETMYPMVRTFI